MSETFLVLLQIQEKTLKEPTTLTKAKSSKFNNSLRRKISPWSKKKRRRRPSQQHKSLLQKLNQIRTNSKRKQSQQNN